MRWWRNGKTCPRSHQWINRIMTKNEKSILRFGLYFMVLGILCSCLIPIYLSNPFEDSGLDLAVPFFVILICAPRLFYDKIWASLLLMTCAILTTLWLLYFTRAAVLQTIANLDVFDGFIFSFLIIVTVIALLSCYLCYRLFKLLFKTKPSLWRSQQKEYVYSSWLPFWL